MKTTVLALFFAIASCVQCVAATTGVMHGYVRDAIGTPVANASVTAASPSQTCTTYTDKRGFFVCISLSPDVYTVSAHKSGTSDAYSAGVRISSDQVTFLVFKFSSWHGCPAFTPAPMATERFTSLDVRQMEAYPPSVAPMISLPMAPMTRHYGCL